MKYTIYKFKDICIEKGFIRGPFGSALKKSLFVEKGDDTYKVYEQCVPLEQDKNSGHYYITGEYFRKSLSRFEVKHNDFLISCSGVNYGAIYHLTAPFEKGVINQALLIIRIDDSIVDYNYFKYLFKIILSKVITTGTGDSTIPNFPSIDVIKDIDVYLPHIEIQKKIGKLLKDIDAKIENNNRINDNLQQQLKLIYDYWFTQFDFPDENGKPYRSSGGAMVWNEQLKRKIPFNWRIMGIKEITDITWGQCPEGKNILDRTAQGDNVLDYCSGAGDMKGGFLVDCQAKTDNSKRIAHKNDILVSIAGKIGDMCVVDHTISLGRATMAYTVKDKKEITFVYLTLQALNRKMTTISTGSIQKVINSDHINDFLFPYQKDIVIQFGELTEDIFSELIKLSHENRQLVKLRDWLLPMLMNGQATISD